MSDSEQSSELVDLYDGEEQYNPVDPDSQDIKPVLEFAVKDAQALAEEDERDQKESALLLEVHDEDTIGLAETNRQLRSMIDTMTVSPQFFLLTRKAREGAVDAPDPPSPNADTLQVLQGGDPCAMLPTLLKSTVSTLSKYPNHEAQQILNLLWHQVVYSGSLDHISSAGETIAQHIDNVRASAPQPGPTDGETPRILEQAGLPSMASILGALERIGVDCGLVGLSESQIDLEESLNHEPNGDSHDLDGDVNMTPMPASSPTPISQHYTNPPAGDGGTTECRLCEIFRILSHAMMVPGFVDNEALLLGLINMSILALLDASLVNSPNTVQSALDLFCATLCKLDQLWTIEASRLDKRDDRAQSLSQHSTSSTPPPPLLPIPTPSSRHFKLSQLFSLCCNLLLPSNRVLYRPNPYDRALNVALLLDGHRETSGLRPFFTPPAFVADSGFTGDVLELVTHFRRCLAYCGLVGIVEDIQNLQANFLQVLQVDQQPVLVLRSCKQVVEGAGLFQENQPQAPLQLWGYFTLLQIVLGPVGFTEIEHSGDNGIVRLEMLEAKDKQLFRQYLFDLCRKVKKKIDLDTRLHVEGLLDLLLDMLRETEE